MMKTTAYFDHTRQRPDRIRIRLEWIEDVIHNPLEEVVQTDARIRRWGWIDEEQKFVRVVLLEDGETVHNAFFDRDFMKRDA